MECKHAQTRLLGYVDGDLRAAERAQVAAHIGSCPACQAELSALQSFDAECGEFLVAPAAQYSTQDLLMRMASVEALDEVQEFLPSLKVAHRAPRLAAAMAMMVMAGNVSFAARPLRSAPAAAEDLLDRRLARLEEALDETEDPGRPAPPEADTDLPLA